MGKLILFLIIIAVIYFLFFKKPQVEQRNDNEDDSKDLIMCEKCKTFTPKNEIKKINGKNICKDCYDNS